MPPKPPSDAFAVLRAHVDEKSSVAETEAKKARALAEASAREAAALRIQELLETERKAFEKRSADLLAGEKKLRAERKAIAVDLTSAVKQMQKVADHQTRPASSGEAVGVPVVPAIRKAGEMDPDRSSDDDLIPPPQPS
ncbi:hypothetical protein B0H17DRAFT_1209528 [Mycena rosella]|uniref:Uncharacterized protein n=1 Tax=Mycena rosella TaxID=1033263 RepID=A0AAD7CYL8_MYCRO|nr:hypothetical protein B0H17DRAFT_1209528 [Mycena rosella]